VQLGRQATEPPGDARQDLEILIDMARRLGLDWDYDGPRAVFDEMRGAMPSIAGISWERLERDGAVTYPCKDPTDPGQPVIFTERFPTPDGRAHCHPVEYADPGELPDAEFPFVMCTGRQLYHWHTGTMTRRSEKLHQEVPEAYVEMHPDDTVRIGLDGAKRVRVASRRGEIELGVRVTKRIKPGVVFIPFHFAEAAANALTHAALDPTAKIPEYKVCAVKVEPVG